MKALVSLTLCALAAGCAAARPPAPAPGDRPAWAGPTWTPHDPPPPLDYERAPLPRVHRAQLSSGVVALIVPLRTPGVVQLRVVFERGAANEARDQAGATNLAMHLLADAKERRMGDGTRQNPWELSARHDFHMIGAALDTEASYDASWLEVSGFAKDLPKYAELIADLLRNPRTGEDSFYARREGIRAALEDRSPSDLIAFLERVSQVAYGPEHPYGRRVYGTRSSLDEMGIETVRQIQLQLVRATAPTLIIAGDVTVDQAMLTAERLFPYGPPNKRALAPGPPVSARYRDAVTIFPRPGAVTSIVCVTRAVPKQVATPGELALAAQIASRRLSQRLRNDLGIAYSPEGFATAGRLGSALTLCARPVADGTATALTEFLRVLSSTERVTEDELVRARTALIAEDDASLGNLTAVVERLTSAAARGEAGDFAAFRAQLEAVTTERLGKLWPTIFTQERFQFVLSGDPVVTTSAVATAKLGRVTLVGNTAD